MKHDSEDHALAGCLTATPRQNKAMQAAHRLLQSRPPWTGHLPTGRACGQPLRGALPAHRSSADAFGLTRCACQTAVHREIKNAGPTPSTSTRNETLKAPIICSSCLEEFGWPQVGDFEVAIGAVEDLDFLRDMRRTTQ